MWGWGLGSWSQGPNAGPVQLWGGVRGGYRRCSCTDHLQVRQDHGVSVRQVLHTAVVDEKPHGNSVRLVPSAHQVEPFALRARRITHAACSMMHAACSIYHTTCSMQHAPCNGVTCNFLHARDDGVLVAMHCACGRVAVH